MNFNELLREPRVSEVTGKPRATLWAEIKAGLFVPPVKISARAIAWPAAECSAINAARISGKSDDDIRALVARLVAARSGAA